MKNKQASKQHCRVPHGSEPLCINHIFYCLYSDALTSGDLLTMEGLPLSSLASSWR